jgi:hypothetical protein
MNKYTTILALAVLSLVLTGCNSLDTLNANTPHLSLSGKIAGQPFSLQNPKDTMIDGLNISVNTNGTASISIQHLSTVMNPTNVVDTGNAEASIISANGVAIVNAINAAASGAVQGAAAVAK